MKKYIAECTGTFALVFCGTGAIIINQVSGGQIGHAGIAITFGLIVMAMIYTFGSLSGAHLNPAVTIAFSTVGLFRWKETTPYIAAQIIGALLASGALKLLFPENLLLGGTHPSGSWLQSFILELILTFFLMLVILFSSQGEKSVQQLAGIAIGSTVLLEAMFAGPVCGASMNPARSFAPAVVSMQIADLWIYLTAPVAGALLAGYLWKFLR